MIAASLAPRSADVLLVEDDPLEAELLIASARRSRFPANVRRVGSGEEALSFLFGEPPYENASLPDLVLLDLNMPGLCGDEVLQRIRTSDDPELRRIPVVMLTSSARQEDVVRAYDLGANAFLTKPAELDGLTALLQNLEAFWLDIARLPSRL